MRLAIYCGLAIIGLAMLWLFRARFITGILDRVYTVLIERPPLDHFRYDNGVLELGALRLYLMSPQFVWTSAVSIDPNGRAILTSDARSFVFGPSRSIPNRSGLPDYLFSPDTGYQPLPAVLK